MQYSMMIALGLFGFFFIASYQNIQPSRAGSSISYEAGNYIRSALFAEDIQHFDDLYLIHVIDGDVPIVIFCNKNYCYRPEDAKRYA